MQKGGKKGNNPLEIKEKNFYRITTFLPSTSKSDRNSCKSPISADVHGEVAAAVQCRRFRSDDGADHLSSQGSAARQCRRMDLRCLQSCRVRCAFDYHGIPLFYSTFVAMQYRAYAITKKPVQNKRFSSFGCVILCSVQRRVIKTKSVEFMPFTLSFFLTLCATTWFFYGLFIKDMFIAVSTI